MTDPRIAPVEDNLESFAGALATSDLLTRGPEPDVVTYHLDRPFPLFNAIVAARFAPGTVEERARQVIAPYLERGLPFMWWTTPSSHAAELEPVLTELGFAMESIPGMYVDLDGPVDPRLPDGVTIEPVDASRLDELLPVFLDGYGIPHDFAPEFATLFEVLFAQRRPDPRPGVRRRSADRRRFGVAHRRHRRPLQHLDARGVASAAASGTPSPPR